jgi:hypothetical protein
MPIDMRVFGSFTCIHPHSCECVSNQRVALVLLLSRSAHDFVAVDTRESAVRREDGEGVGDNRGSTSQNP